MEEKYFGYFYYLMGYCFGLKTKNHKSKELQIYRFEGVKVAAVNDYQNRRLLVWFFKDSTKELHRVCYHGYYVRLLRKKIANHVRNIQEDDNYFRDILMKSRSYSYKKEMAYKWMVKKGYR